MSSDMAGARGARLGLLAALALASLPGAARAQEAAPPLADDPRRARFNDVERGLFTGFEVGYLGLFKTPTADKVKFPFAGEGGGRSSGFLVGATLGYDITTRFAVALYALGASSAASRSYGAFSTLSAGGDLRLAILRARDANEVERLFIYLHGRGGYLLTRPEGLFGTSDLYLAGGPGVEYYTRLRHFSVGLATDLAYVKKAKAFGVAVTPTVRYTF